MDSFEKRLKSLSLAQPSPQLKTRIFGDPPISQGIDSWFHRSIPMRWAMGMALLMGLLGFSAAHVPFSFFPQSPSPGHRLEIRIVEAQQTERSFDFSRQNSPRFLSGNVLASVEIKKGL